MIIKEWKWERVSKKDKKEETLSCPYCSVTVRASSETQIFDVESGAIKYHIYMCPECFMPITIGLDGKTIPTSQFLPYNDVESLPERIGRMYDECRKCFLNECFYSAIMVARTMIMYVAADLGAASNLKFIEYVNYPESEGYISRHSRTWVDMIRTLGNYYIHELGDAISHEADLAISFIMHLLINVYELPNKAINGGVGNAN